MLSWIEIRLLIKEIGLNISGAKIQKISVVKEDDHVEALIKIYKSNLFEKNLFFLVPFCFFLTAKAKNLPTIPHNFTMFLRNNLSGGIIESFEQVGSERIVRLNIRYHDEIKRLYFELFAPGNIILCDEANTILGAYTKKEFRDRTIKNKEGYVIPLEKDLSVISFEDFKAIINENIEIVKILATKLRIGGQLSEEIINRVDIDKNCMGKDVTNTKTKAIYEEFKRIIDGGSKGYFYQERMLLSPIELSILDEKPKIFDSFNKELSNLLSTPKVNKDYVEELKKINSVLEKQRAAVFEIENGIDKNNNLGNAIYEKYSVIERLVSEVKELLKKHNFLDVKEKIKNSKFSEIIDLKTKNKMAINLDKL